MGLWVLTGGISQKRISQLSNSIPKCWWVGVIGNLYRTAAHKWFDHRYQLFFVFPSSHCCESHNTEPHVKFRIMEAPPSWSLRNRESRWWFSWFRWYGEFDYAENRRWFRNLSSAGRGSTWSLPEYPYRRARNGPRGLHRFRTVFRWPYLTFLSGY